MIPPSRGASEVKRTCLASKEVYINFTPFILSHMQTYLYIDALVVSLPVVRLQLVVSMKHSLLTKYVFNVGNVFKS
jgi:hypothetical protein